LIVQDRVQNVKRRLNLVAGVCVVAIASGLGISASSARPQKPVTVATASEDSPTATTRHVSKALGPYYVDFRARTAASYGHSFVWYGRTSERAVEVAGLHPSGDVIPYIIGHLLPVPAETGASYGDLDKDYLTANYKVYLNEADAKKVFAYIKHLQSTVKLWNAPTYNCVSFTSDIAQYMGLKVPSSNLLYPEDWVNEFKRLNGGRQIVRLPATAESPVSYSSRD
jgi:hypothetical protein